MEENGNDGHGRKEEREYIVNEILRVTIEVHVAKLQS